MLKVITVFVHRPGMNRAEFRDYYENSHVNLALSNIGAFGFYKYVRNHVADGPTDPGFDCLTEFYFPSAERSRQAVELLKTPEGKLFADDKHRFIDLSCHPTFAVTERILAGPPRGLDPSPTHKQVLVLRAAPDCAPEKLAQRAADYGLDFARANAASIYRLTLDLAITGPGYSPPYHALLTLWPQPGRTAPRMQWSEAADWSCCFNVETYEATPEQLQLRSA